jgi:hypothetical protein
MSMIKTFTKNDLIRFVYDEVSSEERCEIGSLLKNDSSFLYFYSSYNGMKNLIQKVSLEPSDSVINRILNYSKSFSLHQ